MKIAAVVVTYNRLEFLKECVTSLRNQTRKLDEIFIINNSSTDGTLEWLNEQNDLTVITQENLGGAGGFYTGIKTAYEKGYNWIWCMDDDCLPDKSCLGNQIPETNNIISAPLVIDKDGNKVWSYNNNGPQNVRQKIFSILGLPYKSLAFNGFLLHREVVNKIGLPWKELFIYGDDVEYSFRAIKNGFELRYYPEAILYHPKSKELNQMNEKFLYYYFRNYLQISKKYDFLKIRTAISFLKLFYKLIKYKISYRIFYKALKNAFL